MLSKPDALIKFGHPILILISREQAEWTDHLNHRFSRDPLEGCSSPGKEALR